jgi:Na+(H+)/acetate symporter ActP
VSTLLQGGLKAVVWTDTLQQIIMMGSSVIVMALGIIAVGGLDVAWQRNLDGDRIEFFKYAMTLSASISDKHKHTHTEEPERSPMDVVPQHSRLATFCLSCIPIQLPMPIPTSPKRL